MSIVEQLSAELSGVAMKPEAFRKQLERFKEFKQKLDDAGVVYGDRYQLPLMSRIGQTVEHRGR